ncbi:hypothetical protein [Kitasatospora sp. NPDC097643]|uniref:Rv1733c family protein n=1 Tax=Kitasatospora sp. NPDC097643 TaxID=3157230 RepID=UPI00332AD5A4
MRSASRPTRPTAPVRPGRRHLRRALGVERNPLGRPVDRSRSIALVLAALAFALAAAASTGVSLVDLAHGRRSAELTTAHRHQLDAVVLSPARLVIGGASATHYRATVRWTTASGQHATGPVDVSWPAQTGTVTRVWVDDEDRAAPAPPSPSDLTAQAVALGLAVLAALGVLIGMVLSARLSVLDRRADRLWQRSWTRFEPVWTGRGTR